MKNPFQKLLHTTKNIAQAMIGKSILLIIIFTVFILLITIFSYLKPESVTNKIILYYNSVSSLIIMILTIAYVYTTNGQLSSMKKQLNLMEKSVSLQVQPLPVPNIEKIYLETINAYKSPEDGFTSISVIYRFHCKSSFINAGNGAALNVAIYTSIIFDDNPDAVATQASGQIYCVSDKNSEKDCKVDSMILDRSYAILKALLEGQLSLKMDIYYKNIFGAGFYEQAVYSLHLKSEDEAIALDWLKYISEFIKNKSIDFKRHKALAKTVPPDAKAIFDRIRSELKDKFKENINIEYHIEPESFSIKLIDYDESIKDMDKKYTEIYHKYKNNKDQNKQEIVGVAAIK